jgi:hypothetical protein
MVGRATITPQTFMQPTYSIPQPIRACGPRPPKVTAVAAPPPAAHIVALTPQTAVQLMPKRGPAATVLARRRGARENFMMSIFDLVGIGLMGIDLMGILISVL